MSSKFNAAIFKVLYRARAKDSLPAEVDDGGKGSGNFGHKGRPGQVGGSGKGGVKGVAYSGDGNGGLKQGTFTADYKNSHVTDEQRQNLKNWAKNKANSFFYTGKSGKSYASAGMEIRDEILERVKLRKKAKDLPEWNKEGKVQTEDIYDALRDIRPFGANTEEAKRKILPIISELPQERTDAIVKEALDSIPTDWLEQAEFPVEIHIVNWNGRAHYISSTYGRNREGTIFVYAKEHPDVIKDLELSAEAENLTDMAIANQLRHELGHYIEESNYGIGNMCREYMEARTKGSATEYNYRGEELKPDKFFTSYMGRQYNDGATEILSCCLQALGYANPTEYMQSGFFSGRDLDSYKFILGVLAFKEGGYF